MQTLLWPLIAGAEALNAGAAVPAPAPIELHWWHWAAFGVFVATMLTLDLVVFHRKSHEPGLRESAFWTLFWVALALAFNGLVWRWAGGRAAIEFLTGYLIEWSLSMDNVFVFAVIFAYFRVPLKYQYRVLFWGILGAIVMRLTFILAGAALIKRFDWILLVFGVLLIVTGVKLMFKSDEVHPERNILMRLARRIFRVSKESHGDRFFVREPCGRENSTPVDAMSDVIAGEPAPAAPDGPAIQGAPEKPLVRKLCVTPLFLVLLVIESTDVLFAIDSVPAIFGITQDPFIVFTSNIFAILGLRALYFLLAGVMDLFRYLSYGLAAVLIFVGGKMISEFLFNVHFFKDYPWSSLVVIVVLLGVSVIASIFAQRREPRQVETGEPTGE